MNIFHRDKKRRSSLRRIVLVNGYGITGATMHSGADGGIIEPFSYHARAGVPKILKRKHADRKVSQVMPSHLQKVCFPRFKGSTERIASRRFLLRDPTHSVTIITVWPVSSLAPGNEGRKGDCCLTRLTQDSGFDPIRSIDLAFLCE